MIRWNVRFEGTDCCVVRLGGPGLGNLLFPWARAQVLAQRHGGRLLRPLWRQCKLGPLLRRERDLRWYWTLFDADPQDCGALASCLARRRGPALAEADAAKARPGDVVTVSGMDGLFEPLAGHNLLVAAKLHAILKPRVAEAARALAPRSYIGLHVRLGDFAAPALAGGPAPRETNTRISLAWYQAMVEAARTALGDPTYPALVFSDGHDAELEPLLRMPAVRRHAAGNAASDILLLGQSRCMIASASTFSMWASYLGQPATVWYPGQMRGPLHPALHLQLERGIGDPLPDGFARDTGPSLRL